jgi:hypothetical protein
MMSRKFSLFACAVLLTGVPGRAELLQVDLSIFGMD